MPQLDINGTRLNYTDRGRGRTLLLVHGFPLDARVWAPVADILAKTVRVVVPDLRGFGLNAPADVFSMQELAADMADLMNQLVIAPCAVAGLSMGGYVAQTLAKYQPDTVSQLILVDTKAEADSVDAKAKRDAMAAAAISGGAKAVTEQMLPNMLRPDAPPATVAALRAIMESQHGVTLAAACIAMRDREDFTDFLPTLRIPLSLIFGKSDAISPLTTGEAIAASAPAATLTVIDNAGHMSPIEQSQAVADALLKVLVDVFGLHVVIRTTIPTYFGEKMNREKITWMASGAMLCFLALSVPGSLAQRDNDYRFVRTLVDIYRQVDVNYVEPVDESKLQLSSINGMLGTLDPYTMYVPSEQQDAFNDALDGSFKGVGIRLNQNPDTKEIEVVTPIDDSPAWKAGVLPGDIVLSVNGESIIGQRLEDIIPKIQGPSGSKVTLSLQRNKTQNIDISMTRQEFAVPMVKGFERNRDNTWNYWADPQRKVAYIRLTQFTPEIGQRITAISQKLLKEGMKGMVFDLRFNPGGRLEEAVQLIDLFVKNGTIVTVKGRNRPEQKTMANDEGTLPDFPMAVLVNEHSASASEVMAGSLKDNRRAVVVGARTYGKGSVQEVMPLDANAGELKITVAYWYLPNGERVQRLKDAKTWGVEPDFVVPMDDQNQARLIQEQVRSESMRVVLKTPATTQSASGTTMPTTQPIDPQLDKALAVVLEKLK